MGWLRDETGLEKCAANHVPLTPLSHLNRAAEIFPDREAVVYGSHRTTYRQYRERVTRLASALAARGVRPGEVVATLIPNLPAQVEAHFAVPACGAVLNTINIRLDADTVAYTLGHGEARVLLCDTAFLPLAEAALALMEGPRPELIEVADPQAEGIAQAVALPADAERVTALLALLGVAGDDALVPAVVAEEARLPRP